MPRVTKQQREAFANRLRPAMMEKGYRPVQLAETMGKAPRTIYAWMNGTHFPDAATMRDLAMLLDVSPAWLAFGVIAAAV